MNTRDYWVWLQCALGFGVPTLGLLEQFGDARAVYEADEATRRMSGVFTPRQLQKLRGTSTDEAQRVLVLCERNRWGVLTPESPDYPELLQKIDSCPLVLYYQGEAAIMNSALPIAMVGTRNSSNTSLHTAYRLAASLSRAKAMIVSGGALGIDTAAHEGALRAGGKTVAVLGCGLGTDYLIANHALRENIARQGVLITEFPPFYPASQRTFPIRNRIISGMSCGTVVVEAGERSGSLITAGFALEQGREVFAVPGAAIGSAHTGVNKLIREGAKPVFCAYDVLEDYALRHPAWVDLDLAEKTLDAPPETQLSAASAIPRKKAALPRASKAAPPEPPKPKAAPVMPEHLDGSAKRVWEALREAAMVPDEIALRTGLSIPEIMAALTELEMEGCVTILPGKNYGLVV